MHLAKIARHIRARSHLDGRYFEYARWGRITLLHGLTLTTRGSLQVPLTLYSNDTNLSSGLPSTLLAMKEPIPTSGPAANAPSTALSPKVGKTVTCRFCVSRFRSTLPLMVTLAADPLIRKSWVSITPW